MRPLIYPFVLPIFILFSLLSEFKYAYSWEIPGVPQQPQWFMPIMFEDATGQRDTIYLGYDSTYLMIGTGSFDPAFEVLHHLDTSKFAVYDESYWMFWNVDTVKKIEITGSYYPAIHLKFNKGVFPIKMKWVDSLMYSENLPYPEIEAGRPRARIDMECIYTGEANYFPCGLGADLPPFILSDYDHPDFNSSVWYEPYSLVHSDSLYFEGSGLYIAQNPHFPLSLTLILRPHNDPLSVSVKEVSNQHFSVYPNPFQNVFFINNRKNIHANFSIYNAIGQKVLSGVLESEATRVDLTNFPTGIYWIIIHNKKQNLIYNLLKQ